MPLVIGRRHPVIEVELILADPGVYDLGETISVMENTGELLLVHVLGESISVTEGSMLSNFLVSANAVSEGDVDGKLLQSRYPGESISEDFLDGNTFIYLSQNSYSDGVNDFNYAQWLEAQAISETDTLGDLLRTFGLGGAESDSEASYSTWLSTWPLGEAVSDIEGLFSWVFLFWGSTESATDADRELLTTHQPGQTISDTESIFPNWLYTFAGDAISETTSEFAFVFEYTGETVSETYGSWILSIGMGETVSDTDGEYDFAGKALHDLIELDDTISREVIVTTGVVRIVDVEAYLIRK